MLDDAFHLCSTRAPSTAIRTREHSPKNLGQVLLPIFLLLYCLRFLPLSKLLRSAQFVAVIQTSMFSHYFTITHSLLAVRMTRSSILHNCAICITRGKQVHAKEFLVGVLAGQRVSIQKYARVVAIGIESRS